jgi:hypothetical protein
MPLVLLVLLLLPFKLARKQLMTLAFFLWLVGGLVLTGMGITALQAATPGWEPWVWGGSIAVALIIGFGKGKFVLAKTSQRNIDRLNQLPEPQKPIHVYSVRSWVMISLMVLISLSLTWLDAPMEWRGLVRLAVGFALIMSSLAYLKAPKLAPTPTLPN